MANPWQVGVVCFSVNGQSMASGHIGVFQTGMVVGFYLRWFDSLRDGCNSYCQFQFAVAWSILFYSTVFISSYRSQFGVLGPLEVHAGGFDTYVAIQLYCFV